MESIRRRFSNRKFPARKLRLLRQRLENFLNEGVQVRFFLASISTNNTVFHFNESANDEAEFFQKYSEDIDSADAVWKDDNLKLSIGFSYHRSTYSSETDFNVKLPSNSDMLTLISEFDEWYAEAKTDIEKVDEEDSKAHTPTIFLGHGRSEQWKHLRDHLRDLHGYSIEAYESGSRSGHTIRDIVEEMAAKSDIAFLVHTGEDELTDGKTQSRPNVIHETGLFQGKLGYTKALVLLEEGCEEFSNLAGIQQIRFAKGNIRETFGDVLAALKREFG